MHCVSLNTAATALAAENPAVLNEEDMPALALDMILNISVLILEGRMADKDSKWGYLEGPHCISSHPLSHTASHRCDLQNNLLCIKVDKHAKMIENIWKEYGTLCIEVRICPECACCSNESLYDLTTETGFILERWILFVTNKSVVEVEGYSQMNSYELLQAVRSQLHFSQLCAWWSSNGSTVPTNLTYRITPYIQQSDISLTSHNFTHHTFPLLSLGTGNTYLQVKMGSLPRTENVPNIHCSHHGNCDVTLLDDRMKLECNMSSKRRCEIAADDAPKIDRNTMGYLHKSPHFVSYTDNKSINNVRNQPQKITNNETCVQSAKLSSVALKKESINNTLKLGNVYNTRENSVLPNLKPVSPFAFSNKINITHEKDAFNTVLRRRHEFGYGTDSDVKFPKYDRNVKYKNEQIQICDNNKCNVEDKYATPHILNDEYFGKSFLRASTNELPFCYQISYSDLSSKMSMLQNVSTVSPRFDRNNSNSNSQEHNILERKKKETFFKPKPFLLGNFVECVFKGCFNVSHTVTGFKIDVGVNGLFCPDHLKLPVSAQFYTLGESKDISKSYLVCAKIDEGYMVPKKGSIQVTLFNPCGNVVKLIAVDYSLSDMRPNSHTFLRHEIFYKYRNFKNMRYVLNLKFCSSASGRIYLYEDIKLIVYQKFDLDTAVDFRTDLSPSQSSLTEVPNPKYSTFKPPVTLK